MSDIKINSILIIDNHDKTDIDFAKIFIEPHFKIYLADGIENGLAIAANYTPDIIISSITSIELGRHLIKSLSSQPRTRFIPVIYISSLKWDKDEFREIMNLGVSDCFFAGFNPTYLIASVKLRVKQIVEFRNQIMKVYQHTFETENPTNKDHILITVRKKLYLVKFENIICILAEKEYSKIKTVKGQSIIIRKSLKNWLKILPANEFLQIHRQSIINVNAIEKIEKTKSRSYIVYLKTLSDPLELSRRYSVLMRKTFF